MCLGVQGSNFARLFADLKNEDGGNRAQKSETKIKEMESLAGDDSEEDIKAYFKHWERSSRFPWYLYVKRFSRKRLQEERVDFWIEVELFRRGSGNIMTILTSSSLQNVSTTCILPRKVRGPWVR